MEALNYNEEEPQGMTDEDLVAYIDQHLEASTGDDDGHLSKVRRESFDYVVGKPYGDEREDRSQVVTRECMEAKQWTLPSLLRVFTSGNKVVVFDPTDSADEEHAEQETAIVNHIVQKENDWFLTAYEWFDDALTYPNGYASVMPVTNIEVHSTEYEGQSAEALFMLSGNPDVEIVDVQEIETAIEVAPGVYEPLLTYNFTTRETVRETKIVIQAVPGEAIRVNNSHSSMSLEGAEFVAHVCDKTRPELIQMGLSGEEIDEAWVESGEDYNSERVNRRFEDEDPNDRGPVKTTQVEQCSLLVDFDGDGIAERRNVLKIGRRIFVNEQIDYQPFISISAIPMAHRHAGMSLVDLVKDLQLIQSTLLRGILDNFYDVVDNRQTVSEDQETDDTMDALRDRDNQFVRVRGNAQTAIAPHQHQPVIQEGMALIADMTERQQTRTGVAPNLSLDPSVLQQSTMGSFTAALEQASQRVEMITRIIAECGVKQVMLKTHQLARLYMGPSEYKLGDEWVQSNPAEWKERKRLTANVGLGHNDKSKRLAMIVELLGIQKEAAAMGMVLPENWMNSFEHLTEDADLGNVSEFFSMPEPQPEPQPDPLMVAQVEALQMQSQTAAQKVQVDGQIEMAKVQAKAESDQRAQQIRLMELEIRSRELALQEQEAAGKSDLTAAQVEKTLAETGALEIKARGDDIANDAALGEQTEEAEGADLGS